MTIDSGIVYLGLSAYIALQGWTLKELVGLKGRMHRLEAKYVNVVEVLRLRKELQKYEEEGEE